MNHIKTFLKKYGVIASVEEREAHADLYITQRLWVTAVYLVVLLVAMGYVVCRWEHGGSFPTIRGGLAFGLLGLTIRSASYLNQGESPFPPYLLTYPIVVL